MKAHQEEENILKPPPSKHCECFFTLSYWRKNLHTCLVLDASCSYCVGNVLMEKWAAAYRNIHCWDPYNNRHHYLPATAQPQFGTPGKAASPRGDLSERRCRAIQARVHGGSAPHPSTTCSLTHTIGPLLHNCCLFFFISTVRPATSSQTQSWQRRGRVYSVVARHHLKNNRVQLQIWE